MEGFERLAFIDIKGWGTYNSDWLLNIYGKEGTGRTWLAEYVMDNLQKPFMRLASKDLSVQSFNALAIPGGSYVFIDDADECADIIDILTEYRSPDEDLHFLVVTKEPISCVCCDFVELFNPICGEVPSAIYPSDLIYTLGNRPVVINKYITKGFDTAKELSEFFTRGILADAEAEGLNIVQHLQFFLLRALEWGEVKKYQAGITAESLDKALLWLESKGYAYFMNAEHSWNSIDGTFGFNQKFIDADIATLVEDFYSDAEMDEDIEEDDLHTCMVFMDMGLYGYIERSMDWLTEEAVKLIRYRVTSELEDYIK